MEISGKGKRRSDSTHHSEADSLPSELRVTSPSVGGSDSSAPAGGRIFSSQSSQVKYRKTS